MRYNILMEQSHNMAKGLFSLNYIKSESRTPLNSIHRQRSSLLSQGKNKQAKEQQMKWEVIFSGKHDSTSYWNPFFISEDGCTHIHN